MLAIPIVFQQSGVLLTLLTMAAFMVISGLSSSLLAQAIALIPGNCHYERRFEFSSAVLYFWGPRWHALSALLLNITIQSYNLASIVICAQSVDQALVELFGHTYALTLYPHAGVAALDQAGFDVLTSGAFSLSLTLGYLVVVALFLPTCFQVRSQQRPSRMPLVSSTLTPSPLCALCLQNLDDNVKTVQLASFLCCVAILVEFAGFFVWQGAKPAKDGGGFHAVALLGGTYSQLISVFIFSWSYGMFVPSWLNEKRDSVSVNRVIWGSGFVALLGYAAFGLLCASVEVGIVLDNILPLLSQSAPVVTRIFAHAFALTIIAPGIPICAVSTRCNLQAAGVFSVRMAYFLSAVLPFLVAFLFSSGAFFANLLVWSSLLFNGQCGASSSSVPSPDRHPRSPLSLCRAVRYVWAGIVNFLIPHALYLTAVDHWKRRRRARRRSQMEAERRASVSLTEPHINAVKEGEEHKKDDADDDALDDDIDEAEVEDSREAADGDLSALEEAEDPTDTDATEASDEEHLHTPALRHASMSLNSGPAGLTLASSLLPSDGALAPSLSFHLPTSRSRHHPVYPFSRHRWLNARAVPLTWAVMVGTSLLIAAQIGTDLWYLLWKNENLLSG